MTHLLQDKPATIMTLAFRPRGAAKALDLSPRTLWQLTKDGKIPCVRIGTGKRGIVLYPVSVLTAWLEAQAQTTKGEVDDNRD